MYKGDTQGDSQGDTQGDSQGDTQGDTQGSHLDMPLLYNSLNAPATQ